MFFPCSKRLASQYFAAASSKSGLGKETQTHDAGFISIKRTHRKIRAVDFRATRTDLDSWIFQLIFKGVGFALRAALIEPQLPTLGIGAGCLFKARIVDQSQIFQRLSRLKFGSIFSSSGCVESIFKKSSAPALW